MKSNVHDIEVQFQHQTDAAGCEGEGGTTYEPAKPQPELWRRLF